MMRNRTLAAATLAVLVGLALAATGCYGQPNAPSGAEPGGAGGTPPGGSTTGGPAVTMQNFAFNPSKLQVKVGDTVTWTNQDSAPHTVTGDAFQSAQLAAGGTYSFTFDKAGTYAYKCSIHPTMTGTVVVK